MVFRLSVWLVDFTQWDSQKHWRKYVHYPINKYETFSCTFSFAHQFCHDKSSILAYRILTKAYERRHHPDVFVHNSSHLRLKEGERFFKRETYLTGNKIAEQFGVSSNSLHSRKFSIGALEALAEHDGASTLDKGQSKHADWWAAASFR